MATAAELAESLAPLVSRCRTDVTAVKRKDGVQAWTKEALTEARLLGHVMGGPARGVCPIKAGESTTQVALLDFDSHKGEVPWGRMVITVARVVEELDRRGLHSITWRSSGGRGIHLYLLWDAPQDAYSVRQFLGDVLESCGLRPGTKGVKHHEVEVFPKQDSVPADGYGNQFILPLAGQSVPLDVVTGLMDREDAVTLPWPVSPPVPVYERPAPADRMSTVVSPDLVTLRSALAAIPNEGADELGYDEWFAIVAGIHFATGGSEEGFALAEEFSARSSKHNAEFFEDRVWRHLRSDREKVITDCTIYWRARQQGWHEPCEFEDLKRVSLDAAPGAAVAPHNAFPIISIREMLEVPSRVDIIDEVIPDADIVMVYGESGSGKSFFTLDMQIAIALGRPWRGRNVLQRRCLYVAAEGRYGVRNRLAAAVKYHGFDLDAIPLRVMPASPNLRLAQQVDEVLRSLDSSGGTDVIAFDTLAQCIPGANENGGEDMTTVLEQCKRLRDRSGALIVLVHHAGKDPSKGARGWSGTYAAMDAVIEVNRSAAARSATVAKQKDGEDGMVFPFKLLPVPLGTRPDGKAIVSCVVEHEDLRSVVRPLRRPTGDKQKLVLDMVREVQCVGDDADQAAVVAAALERLPSPPKDAKKDNRGRDVRRALESLQQAGFIELSNGRVRVRQ